MKKRFITLGIISAIVITMASAYAGNTIMNNISLIGGQSFEISAALQSKNVLKHFNEEVEDSSSGGVSVMAMPTQGQANYNQSKAIQCYRIFDVDSKDSILNYLSSAPAVIVPVERENVVVGFATLEEGISVKEAAEILESKNIATAEKNRLLDEVERYEGKLKIASVNKLADDFESATLYFNKDAIAEVVEEEITEDVTNEKYVHIVRDNMYAYVFTAGGEEYMIPYDLSVCKDLVNGKIYRVEEAIEAMCAAY